MEELKQKAEKANADLDYFQFQFNQLEEAKLMQGEQEELETELEKLTHSEEIKSALIQVRNYLMTNRFLLFKILKIAIRLENIQDYIAEVPELTERLQSSFQEFKDILE